MDFGASDHLASNPFLFSTLIQPKTPYIITLAEGSKTKAIGIGQATPLPSLSIDSVILFSNCPLNLIFVSRLTNSLSFKTFTSNSFLIQGWSMGRTIG